MLTRLSQCICAIAFVAGGLLAGLVQPAFAIEEFTPSIALQNAAVATGNGTSIAVANYSSVALQVTIATTATVTFEGTQDGSTWSSLTCILYSDTGAVLVTQTTATGTYKCNIAGLGSFRARISAWTSGRDGHGAGDDCERGRWWRRYVRRLQRQRSHLDRWTDSPTTCGRQRQTDYDPGHLPLW